MDAFLFFIYSYLPPLLLVVAAALWAWRWQWGLSRVFGALVALAVAAWQVFMVARSMCGWAWDPVFHGVKLGILLVAVVVDIAGAWLLLKRDPAGGRLRGQMPGVFLLMLAALLYVLALPWLATTGE